MKFLALCLLTTCLAMAQSSQLRLIVANDGKTFGVGYDQAFKTLGNHTALFGTGNVIFGNNYLLEAGVSTQFRIEKLPNIRLDLSALLSVTQNDLGFTLLPGVAYQFDRYWSFHINFGLLYAKGVRFQVGYNL